ncbi:hypothetical protein J1TS5_05940 [Paenibacillus macerans]|nr:hypothetical protein J1TS5_05940 [Paenibacillus macerans]
MNLNKKSLIGPALVLIGICLLFFRKEAVSAGTIFGQFWPTLFVIPVGLFFHWMYFSMTDRRATGLLIPGGILFTAGLVLPPSLTAGNTCGPASFWLRPSACSSSTGSATATDICSFQSTF